MGKKLYHYTTDSKTDETAFEKFLLNPGTFNVILVEIKG